VVEITYRDQLDIFDPADWTWPVHVIGLGGIGSALLLPLAKIGVGEIHIWDDDRVEAHNVPAQMLYRKSDVGRKKVDAALDVIGQYELPVTLIGHDQWVDETTDLEGVVLSGVDSMLSRKAIWQAVKDNALVPLYMDGRIASEFAQVLTIDPVNQSDIEEYEGAWLFDDASATALPCASRTIIHPPLQVAAWMTANLTLFARGERLEVHQIGNLGVSQYTAGVR